jgi:hypothetical protein
MSKWWISSASSSGEPVPEWAGDYKVVQNLNWTQMNRKVCHDPICGEYIPFGSSRLPAYLVTVVVVQ